MVYKLLRKLEREVSEKLVLPAGDKSGAWDCMAFSRKSTRRSVFAARPKIKHHWSKSEAKRPNNELRNSLHGGIPALEIREIIRCINASDLTINVATISLLIPVAGGLGTNADNSRG